MSMLYKGRKGELGVQDILEELPPNYTIGGLIINGLLVPVTSFLNDDNKLGYFIYDDQVVFVDTNMIDGLVLAPAKEVEEGDSLFYQILLHFLNSK